MVALSAEERIDVLSTPYQYLLLSAPPEMEAAFQQKKTRFGSEFCFHGSATANWHCILRQGLKNASGTRLMTAGQAHGPGIYLARDSATSAAYSMRNAFSVRPYGGASAQPPGLRREQTGARTHDPSSMLMLAVCEVALVPDLKRSGSIWVCRDEAAVVTRFFLVFHATHMPNIRLDDTDTTAKIRVLTSRMCG